jgi:8-oxo-dGTP pyrophosphatase MutT (NUDIX family)
MAPEAGSAALRSRDQLRCLEATVMPLRPDLIECWVFRVVPSDPMGDRRTHGERLEILLIRRARHRIFPGLWQCVTGGVEPGERIPAAAMREVLEETGLGPAEIETFYDLDQVAPFYDEGADAVVVSAIFAARVRPDAEARESWEHDGLRWVPATDAPALAIWPSYGESIRRVRELLLDPAMAPWFALDVDGNRVARRPLEER